MGLAGDTAVDGGGRLGVLYAWFAGDRDPQHSVSPPATEVCASRGLSTAGPDPLGIAHFTYLEQTVPLVPDWLPWHVAWAYFTGGALIAAGVAVVIGVCARLAATLSALEMGLFTLLVWVPIVVAGPTAFQWSEFVNSWALTAAAWLVADSYRGMPWFANVRARKDPKISGR